MVERLQRAAVAALSDPTLAERLIRQGLTVSLADSTKLRRFVAAEVTRWGDAVKLSGARQD